MEKKDYRTMVANGMESCASQSERIDAMLFEAEQLALSSDTRLTHDEVFGGIRRALEIGGRG